MKIGDFIKTLRLQHNLSQEELGKIVGVQRAAVQKWESGAVENLKRTTIQKLAEYFNINPACFIAEDFPAIQQVKKGIKIPVLGSVRAGVPEEAAQEVLEWEEISEDMLSQGEHFGLMVKGSSMEPKFSEGDVVIVRKQSTAETGDIVIALINGDEATIKKLKKMENGIMLVPANPNFEAMYYTNEEIEKTPVRIIGKVVELRAKFN